MRVIAPYNHGYDDGLAGRAYCNAYLIIDGQDSPGRQYRLGYDAGRKVRESARKEIPGVEA